jgi:uroporphyrinogen decarboxylase
MNSRERIQNLIGKKTTDRTGLWLGSPDPASWPGLHAYFDTKTEEGLRLKLGDDIRWICPQFDKTAYQHPEGKTINFRGDKKGDSDNAPLAYAESVADVDRFDWPDSQYYQFDKCLSVLKNTGDYYRASGMWTCFFQDLIDLFGMENYMIKMYSHPEVVEAATDRLCQFYYETNKHFFEQAGNMVDAFFFANDMGTQQDVILSRKLFRKFIFPWFVKFTNLAKQHGYQVILHSCGSIHRIIPDLIDIGIDCLHPVQAGAHNMSAEVLGKEFGGKIAFLGGVDTQDLLVNATPQQVKDRVNRMKELLGPGWIVSPSHEGILPDISPRNIEAMAQAALENA